MRIALDVTPLAGAQTGIGRFVAELAGGLTADTDVELVGLAMTARGREQIAAQLGCDQLGCETPLSRHAPARVLRWLWQRVDWPPVELLTGKVDLVHGTNYVVPPTRNAAQLVTVHDLAAWHDPSLVDQSSKVYPQLVKRALERGAHVHTVSNHVASEIQAELGLAADRLHVVYNGISEGPAPTPGAGSSIASGHPYVLALGTIEPRKDFPLLVEAFREVANVHSDVHLVIAGGSGWGGDELASAIERSGLGDRIICPGFVSAQQKADLLGEAELLVSAARYEGFGIVPLEAMAAGIPVVAADGGAISEVCGNAAKLVPVGDASALSQAMLQVLGDDELTKQLVAAGAARAAEFSWRNTVTSMVDVYRQLCSDR